jgi:hypothetical protein
MEPDRGLTIHQHEQAGSQKRKKREKHLRSQAERDISQKKKYLHKYKPSD